MQKNMSLDIAMTSLDQMTGYVKCFDDNKAMAFLADDTSSGLGESRKEFLKEYIKVWGKN